MLINVAVLQELSIGTANKIFLEFPNKWWPEDIVAFNFLWSEENKNEFLQKYGQVSKYNYASLIIGGINLF